jgi:hypothetical protein
MMNISKNKITIIFFIAITILLILLIHYQVGAPARSHSRPAVQNNLNVSGDYLSLVDQLRVNNSDSFAGAFLDDQGKLNINLIHGTTPSRLHIDEQKIAVHYVKYSYDELQSAYDHTVTLMSNPVIRSVELNERANKVFVNITDVGLQEELLSEINHPAVEVKIVFGIIRF